MYVTIILNPNLQKITLQCVGGYKQKTPLLGGALFNKPLIRLITELLMLENLNLLLL